MTRDLGWTLVQFVWQGSVLATVYALVRWWMGARWSMQARYRWACLTLFAMAATPAITFFSIKDAALPRSAWPLASSAAWEPILPQLTWVWLAGVALFCGRLARNWRATSMLRKVGVELAPAEWRERFANLVARMRAPDRVRLLISTKLGVPATTGWLRPVVFLPATMLAGLPDDQIEALIAHELAHVIRFDYLVNVLQSVVEAILFYHPAVWWVSGTIREEREFLCDDIATAACGDRLGYAQALAAMETIRQSQLVLAATDGPLLARIRRLVGPQQPALSPAAATTIAMSVLWAAAISAMLVRAEPQQPAANPEPVVLAQQVALPSAPSNPLGPLQAPVGPAPQGQASTKRSVIGRVLSSTGEAVALAEVTMLLVGSGDPFITRSGDDGRFRFEDVTAGSYTITARKAGFLPMPSPATARVADSDLSPLTLQLTAQAVITGEVLDRYGEPLSLGQVSAFRLAYTASGGKRLERVQAATLDDQGRFRFSGLTAGRYYVGAGPAQSPTGQTGNVATVTFFPNALNLDEATAIDLLPGMTHNISIRIRYEDLHTIRGRVEFTGVTGAHLPRVTLRPAGPEGVPVAGLTPKVSPDGTFEIPGVPPGQYQLEGNVCFAQNQCYDGNNGSPVSTSGQTAVTVRNGDVNGIALRVQVRLRLDGIVKAESGDLSKIPVRGAMIGLAQEGSTERLYPGIMSAGGTFRISVLDPGLYRAFIANMPDTLYVKSVRIDGQDALAGQVNISEGSKIEVLVAENPAYVTGIVRDANGIPVSGVAVTVWSANMATNLPAPEGRTATTDGQGAFRIGGLGPGDYRVAAWEAETAKSEFLKIRPFLAQFSAEAAKVNATAGSTLTVDPKLIPKSAIAVAMTKLP